MTTDPPLRMLRFWVRVGSDRPKKIVLSGDPRHVEANRLGAGPDAQHLVEFWAEGTLEEGVWQKARWFQAFGTGQALPLLAKYWGTTARTAEGGVWHLYEVPAGGDSG